MKVLPSGVYCLVHYEMTQEILEHLRSNLDIHEKMPKDFSLYYVILSYGHRYLLFTTQEPITNVPSFYKNFYNPQKCLKRS